MMNQEQVKAEMRREYAKERRLLERVELAKVNLELVRGRLRDLKAALKTAPPAPKFW